MPQATDLFLGADIPGLDARLEINSIVAALASAHKGPVPPSYAIEGMTWMDDSANPLLVLKVYSGSEWLAFMKFDTATNTVSVPFTQAMPAAEGSVGTAQLIDGAIELSKVATSTPHRYLYFDADGNPSLQQEQRTLIIKPIPNDEDLTVGNNLNNNRFNIPVILDGMVLADATAYLFTGSSAVASAFQIHNVTSALDLLSTPLTVDPNTLTSDAATLPAVIHPANHTATAGHQWQIDCDTAGVGARGLEVHLTFRRL